MALPWICFDAGQGMGWLGDGAKFHGTFWGVPTLFSDKTKKNSLKNSRTEIW
jgi:hypothetical protein